MALAETSVCDVIQTKFDVKMAHDDIMMIDYPLCDGLICPNGLMVF